MTCLARDALAVLVPAIDAAVHGGFAEGVLLGVAVQRAEEVLAEPDVRQPLADCWQEVEELRARLEEPVGFEPCEWHCPPGCVGDAKTVQEDAS